MPNETHQETRDTLVLLREGLLGGDETRSVQAHLAQCSMCKDHWEELVSKGSILDLIDPRELAEQLPELNDEPHATTETLWRLADSYAGPPPAEDLEMWTHVLGCRRCYLALTGFRERLGMEVTVDEETLEEVSQTITEKWRELQFTVLMSFAAANLRIRIRSTGTRARNSGGSALRNYHSLIVSNREETTMELKPEERWEHDRDFGEYRFKLILFPQDAEQEKIAIGLKIERLPAATTRESLRVTLRSVDSAELASLSFQTEEIQLAVVPLGHYSIDFVNDATNEFVGIIELLRDDGVLGY
jgi:hypothetical protein